jgi:hypothetical protein
MYACPNSAQTGYSNVRGAQDCTQGPMLHLLFSVVRIVHCIRVVISGDITCYVSRI